MIMVTGNALIVASALRKLTLFIVIGISVSIAFYGPDLMESAYNILTGVIGDPSMVLTESEQFALIEEFSQLMARIELERDSIISYLNTIRDLNLSTTSCEELRDLRGVLVDLSAKFESGYFEPVQEIIMRFHNTPYQNLLFDNFLALGDSLRETGNEIVRVQENIDNELNLIIPGHRYLHFPWFHD